MALKFSQLAIFCALVEEGTIYAAAEKMYCVPSNITSRIKDLEQSLNVALFFREHRKLNITPEGRAFYFKAKAILEQTRQCQNLFRQPHPIGTLKIGGLSTLFEHYIQPQSLTFLQQQTTAQIHLLSASTEDLLNKLQNAEVDLIVIDHPIQQNTLVSQKIATETYYFVSRTEQLIEPQQHAYTDTLLSCQQSNQQQALQHEWLEQQHIEYQRHCQLQCYGHILDAIQQGVGFSIIPSTYLIEARRRQLYTSAIPALSQDISMLWQPHHPSALLHAFIELFQIEKSP